MKIIGIVPARKGSKSIKNKNIFKINKKALIEYTFAEIKKSKLNRCYVLTDSQKIKKIANNYKINSNYIRPKKLSNDDTSLLSNLVHFYKWLDNEEVKFDYLLVLQPTSPARSFFDINSVIKILKKKKPDSLFSVNISTEHPYESIKVKKSKWYHILSKAKKFYRRQDFDFDSFFINGAIYAIHNKIIRKKKLIGSKHALYKMPKIRSFDIDDHEDIEIIRKILK
tara:strand:+ start:774 stop:1448 length:675 start_codon:yes stop_codon:yes gene_type:complete